MKILKTFFFTIFIVIVVGCQSTFRPKLNSAEKIPYKFLKAQFDGDPMQKYVDIFFVKNCENLFTYSQQHNIRITSIEGADIHIETPEKRTIKINVNNLDSSYLVDTNSEKTFENKSSAAREMHLKLLMPSLKKQGIEKYAELFVAGDCEALLLMADKLNVKPTIISRNKVVVFAENGEKM